jgi:hypothetical protein
MAVALGEGHGLYKVQLVHFGMMVVVEHPQIPMQKRAR